MNSIPPRVVLLVENNSYPLDFRVRREASTLRSVGCKVTVIAPRSRGQRWLEDVDGVRVYRFPAPPDGRGLFGYAVEFGYATFAMLILTIWVWLRSGFEVIHAANPPDTCFVIGGLFRLVGKRYVFDQHDLAPEVYLSRFQRPRENLIYHVLRFFERCSYAAAHVVIATNESYKELAVSRGRKSPRQVFIVRNGPPLSFAEVEPDADVVRRARHLIGYVGTIGPQDGLDYWIRAVHELVSRFGRTDFLSIVIGDGDSLPEVRRLAAELGVDRHVWFTGRLAESDVRKYLSAVHVCVQPDPLSPLNDRSTMNKLMEYMALGKPTVAFDLKETRCSAREAAIYVPPNDVVEFARAVHWLLDNAAVRETMGNTGRRRVRDELAWEYSAEALLRAYREGLRARLTIDLETRRVST
jgi:glycosyltransferase involved in cell wall biosynthesis